MTPTQQRKFHFHPADWQLVSTYATAVNMTAQAWLVNVVIGDWMREQGHEWQGVGTVGNPQWIARDAGRCVCTAAQCAEDSITCETCGKDLFSADKGGE